MDAHHDVGDDVVGLMRVVDPAAHETFHSSADLGPDRLDLERLVGVWRSSVIVIPMSVLSPADAVGRKFLRQHRICEQAGEPDVGPPPQGKVVDTASRRRGPSSARRGGVRRGAPHRWCLPTGGDRGSPRGLPRRPAPRGRLGPVRSCRGSSPGRRRADRPCTARRRARRGAAHRDHARDRWPGAGCSPSRRRSPPTSTRTAATRRRSGRCGRSLLEWSPQAVPAAPRIVSASASIAARCDALVGGRDLDDLVGPHRAEHVEDLIHCGDRVRRSGRRRRRTRHRPTQSEAGDEPAPADLVDGGQAAGEQHGRVPRRVRARRCRDEHAR